MVCRVLSNVDERGKREHTGSDAMFGARHVHGITYAYADDEHRRERDAHIASANACLSSGRTHLLTTPPLALSCNRHTSSPHASIRWIHD